MPTSQNWAYTYIIAYMCSQEWRLMFIADACTWHWLSVHSWDMFFHKTENFCGLSWPLDAITNLCLRFIFFGFSDVKQYMAWVMGPLFDSTTGTCTILFHVENTAFMENCQYTVYYDVSWERSFNLKWKWLFGEIFLSLSLLPHHTPLPTLLTCSALRFL